MALALKGRPPGRGSVRPVDGGVALRHRESWTSEKRHWVAYTVEELTPIPDVLFCPVCESPAQVRAGTRDMIADLLGAYPTNGKDEA